MTPIAQLSPPVNQSITDDDFDSEAWRDRAAHKIASQFSLPINIAKVVVGLAGLGAGGRP
jgi:hypothetical protein